MLGKCENWGRMHREKRKKGELKRKERAGAPLIQGLVQFSRENAQVLLPPVMVHFSPSLFPSLPPSLCLSAPFVLQTDL